MAYTALDSGNWGTGPKIPISFYYDYQRSGTSMQYKVKIVFGTVNGASYFGYPIYIDLSLDGVKRVTQYTAKSASPSQWSSAIIYESGWITVSNKVEGSTALIIRLYSGNGNTRDTSYKYNLAVSPAATTPTFSATTVIMGQSVTISLPRASSSYTHVVTYYFQGLRGQIASAATTSVSWTPPISLASQIPNATSGTCTIGVGTWDGDTLIGTKEVTITLVVPDSVKPSVSGVAISEAVSGIASKFGCYVQSKSKLNVNVTAAGAYGSTISNISTTFEGATYSGSSFTTNAVTTSGTLSMVTTITDSRGRTASTTTSVTIVTYTPPQIMSLTAYRINTSGSADDSGERIAVAVKYAIATVNSKNTRLYSARYKISGATSFSTVAENQAASVSYDGTLKYTSSPTISGDNAWVIRFELADYFTTVAAEVEIPSAFTIMDFRSTGKGVAIGKVSEKDAFEVAMDAEFTGETSIIATDMKLLKLYRSDGKLCAFLEVTDGGDGLTLQLYTDGSVSDVVKFTKYGAVSARSIAYGTAVMG